MTAWRRFWFELPTTRGRVAAVRFLFFGLVALQTWFSLVHASRYGAGDFNVSHFPALDAWLPVPTRTFMVVTWIAEVYLAVGIALGATGPRAVRLLTVLYGITYFVSQLDSYQHHYLVFLVLVVWSTFPRASAMPAPSDGSWQRRLILAQLSIVYLWAAFAKLDSRWLDGSVLGLQLGGQPQPALAIATIAVELFLAVALQVRRLWWVAVPVGMAFHAGIEILGFDIELFSYLVMALYLLALPERLWARLPRLPWPASPPSAGHAAAAAVLVLLALTTDVARDHHRYLGGDARRRGDTATAIRAYEHVIAIDPDHADAHRRLEELRRLPGGGE